MEQKLLWGACESYRPAVSVINCCPVVCCQISYKHINLFLQLPYFIRSQPVLTKSQCIQTEVCVSVCSTQGEILWDGQHWSSLWLSMSSQISCQSDTAHLCLLVSRSICLCRGPAASSHTRCTKAIWGRPVSRAPALGCQMVLRKNFELFSHPKADWSRHV